MLVDIPTNDKWKFCVCLLFAGPNAGRQLKYVSPIIDSKQSRLFLLTLKICFVIIFDGVRRLVASFKINIRNCIGLLSTCY